MNLKRENYLSLSNAGIKTFIKRFLNDFFTMDPFNKERFLLEPSLDLAYKGPRLLFLNVGFLCLSPAGVDVDLRQRDEFRLEDQLPPNKHDDEQDQTNIRDEEVGDVPRNESSEALGEDDEDVEEQSVVGEVWLERSDVRKGLARNTARCEGSHETDVAHLNAGPSDEASNTRYVQKPVEDVGCGGAQVHEPEESNGGGEEHSIIWNSAGSCVREETWGKTLASKTKEDTRAGVDV